MTQQINITENLLFIQELLNYLTEYDRSIINHLELLQKISFCLSQFMESSQSNIFLIDSVVKLVSIYGKATEGFIHDLKYLIEGELRTGKYGVLLIGGYYKSDEYESIIEQYQNVIAFFYDSREESFVIWTLDNRTSFILEV